MDIEPGEIRFGVIAVRKGYVKPTHIVNAIQAQIDEDLTTGSHRRIGEILLQENLLDQTQLEEVLKIQRSES